LDVRRNRSSTIFFVKKLVKEVLNAENINDPKHDRHQNVDASPWASLHPSVDFIFNPLITDLHTTYRTLSTVSSRPVS